ESINDIMEYSSHIQCSIAPNPNYGQFKLQLSEVPEKATIEFYNALGQLIQVENIENSSETFDLKPHTGMIFYTIVSDNKMVFRGKMIVR
ncbi:MAG TPA: T9SS type A sorting domain-containing protein, partial [Bacteroidales bacterium]|nr:T9SS type A sorting domain-containing protein [Bacteroidales bacterium]